jgi:dTDP-glucose 4,6-dehydratase
MTVLRFAEIVNELTGNKAGIIMKESERIKGDPQMRRPDTTRAKEILGWQPKVTLAEGLPPTVAYFRDVI